jgi:hypothetical protein
MKTIIKTNGKEYECKVWNGVLTGYVEVGIAEIIYPKRKFFKCGFFVHYTVFDKRVKDFDSMNSLVKECMGEYLLIELKKKEEKKIDLFLDKVIEM